MFEKNNKQTPLFRTTEFEALFYANQLIDCFSKDEDMKQFLGNADRPHINVAKELVTFETQKYTRKMLAKNEYFKLMLLGWEPGQKSNDIELPSNSIIRVLDGVLTKIKSEVEMQLSDTSVYIPDDEIYSIKNESPDRAISLHLIRREVA